MRKIHTPLTILMDFRHFQVSFICFPCSMGSTFSHMVQIAFYAFLRFKAPLAAESPQSAFQFLLNIAMKRCFSLVGGSLFFCGSSLGLFFIKACFRAAFFAFFSFCYTSHAKRTIFKMRSGTFLAHFAIMRFTADV